MNAAAIVDSWKSQIRVGIGHVQPHAGRQIFFFCKIFDLFKNK